LADSTRPIEAADIAQLLNGLGITDPAAEGCAALAEILNHERGEIARRKSVAEDVKRERAAHKHLQMARQHLRSRHVVHLPQIVVLDRLAEETGATAMRPVWHLTAGRIATVGRSIAPDSGLSADGWVARFVAAALALVDQHVSTAAIETAIRRLP
jgi:hypothetical protein